MAPVLAWDRSHDWVVHRFCRARTRVTIRFRGTSPSVTELVSLRRCLPDLRDMAPAALRAMIGECGKFSPGILESIEAIQFTKSAEKEGLHVVAEDASFIGYMPFDRTIG